MFFHDPEKEPVTGDSIDPVTLIDNQVDEENEVFRVTSSGEQYRTVSWYKSFALMFKILFSVGVLSIPSVFSYVGALPGALLLIGWGAFNAYSAFLLGAFRLRHSGIHGMQDMAYIVGGVWYRELVGVLFIIGYDLVAGSGYIGVATALNTLSDHGACTVWFSFVAFVLSTAIAMFPKLAQVGVAAWAGVITLFISIFILVVAVAVNDRPALAPPTGDFDLGYHVIGSPNFTEGMTAALTIFISSGGISAFVPIIAEMKNPKEYKKPIAVSMGFLNACYLAFALVIYRYCGTWISSPALGSAGPLIKKLTYGIALPGLIMSSTVNQHLAAKYIFVRLLRGTKHLQSKTMVHWATWFGVSLLCGVAAFVIGEAVPFFGTLISLLAAIAYAPMAIVIPMHLWLYDFADYRKQGLVKKLQWLFHLVMLVVGLFMTVAGAYTSIKSIADQYAAGTVSSAFSCADKEFCIL